MRSFRWGSGPSTARAASRASRVKQVGCGPFELLCCILVGAGVREGEAVPEFPELGFFLLCQDAVGQGVGHALFPALLEGLVYGGAVAVGAAGDLG